MEDNKSAKNYSSYNSLSSCYCKKHKDSNHLTSEIYSEENKEAFSSSK